MPRGVGQIGASSLDCVGVATFHDDEEFAAEEPDVLVIGYLDDDLVWVTVMLHQHGARRRARDEPRRSRSRWRAVRRTWVRHEGDGDYVVCRRRDPGAQPAWEMNRVPECFERQDGRRRRRKWARR